MKEILHRLPMRFKFALVLVLPLIALGWFAASGAIARQAVVNELSRMQALTALAQQAGGWVHQVQQERGMTAGFLGSQGKVFGDRLRQQRSDTDAAAEAFFQQRDQLDATLLTSTISSQLAAVEQQWQQNQSLRDQVDLLSVATPEALGHYTGLNSLLMVLVGGVIVKSGV